MAVCLVGAALCSSASAQTSSQSGPLQFELTFSNPNQTPLYLTGVGLQVRPLSGAGSCKGFSRLVAPKADYIVTFLVWQEGLVTVDATPPLQIPPKQVRSFTIGVQPNESGACAYWVVEVRPISFFSNGSRIVGSKYVLTQENIEKFKTVTQTEEQLISYLKDPREEVRLQGLEFLHDSNSQFDDATLAGLLRHKFSDPSVKVRRSAANIAGQRKLRHLSKEILNALASAQRDSGEHLGYLDALGNMGGIEAAPAVLNEAQLCKDYLDLGCEAAIRAAKKMNEVWLPQEATKILKSFLSSNTQVFSKDHNPKGANQQFGHYGNFLILIAYRWTESQPLFADLLLNNKYVGVRKPVLHHLAAATGLYQYDLKHERKLKSAFLERDNDGTYGFLVLPSTVEEHPFIAGHRQIYRQLASDDDSELRAYALFLYFATSKDVSEVKDLVRVSLYDTDEHILAIGAQAAANFGLQEHLEAIEKKYKELLNNSFYNDSLDQIYCRSLKKLGRDVSSIRGLRNVTCPD